jgi:hypothetical protein
MKTRRRSLTSFRHYQLRARIKEILPEVETAYVEILNLGDGLDREAEEHGRRACRNICKAISTRLPREVRDMVYGYLMDSDKNFYIQRGYEIHLPQCLSSPVATRLWEPQAPSTCLPPWVRESYMGKAVAFEMVERWYATRSFVIFENATSLLSNFLTHDIYETGIVVGDVVQHIRFCTWNATKPYLLSLVEDVSCLNAIRNKHIKVAFVRSSMLRNEVTAATLLDFLKLVGPAVLQLRSAGHQGVSVETSNPSIDLTYIFDMPGIDFEAGLVSFCS